jgi:hypothetical protein
VPPSTEAGINAFRDCHRTVEVCRLHRLCASQAAIALAAVAGRPSVVAFTKRGSESVSVSLGCRRMVQSMDLHRAQKPECSFLSVGFAIQPGRASVCES